MLRFYLLKKALNNKPLKIEENNFDLGKEFGKHVLDFEKIKNYLPENVYHEYKQVVEKYLPISKDLADVVAQAMKKWAKDNGATHYTHWFHPLNEISAEKHDSFLEFYDKKPIETLKGEKLIQQEPDASSFPTGGLRTTFEARGYTVWDLSTPVFIYEKVLCIPTFFISYSGESIDNKLPLFKSVQILKENCKEFLQIFNKNFNEEIINTFGWEQEYFLVDRYLYEGRPDLIMTGRTLVGHRPAKGQQLEDHYLGSIPPRVKSFMTELEYEAWRLGIPVKTRHNEVAPNQYECASLYEDINIAVAHNILIMELIQRIGYKHNFKVLLHEKPFEGVNGSGKHCNWSLMTSNGENLLKLTYNKNKFLRFISLLSIIISAVYEYSNLLKSSICSLSNEYRLGGYEAPPNILSIYLGQNLTNILENIESINLDNLKNNFSSKNNLKNLNVILKDETDRNRTSPIAFTGSRFEIRAVGSSFNPSFTLTIFNLAVAKQLKEFITEFSKYKNLNFEKAILKTINSFYNQSKLIIYNGNGYSNEWKQEAIKRNLCTETNTVKILKYLVSDKSISLFTSFNVFTFNEIKARYDVKLEYYIRKLLIEYRVLRNMIDNHILPAVLKHKKLLLTIINTYKKIYNSIPKLEHTQLELIETNLNKIYELKNKIAEEVDKAEKIADIEEKALILSENVKPMLTHIREYIDNLEYLVDDKLWPLPKYRELLFIR